MTKKYEKFEEWMVGKTVLCEHDKGVVTREHGGVGSWVWVEWEDQLIGETWIAVESLTFLNIPCSDTQSQSNDTPIPWEEGQVVWDLLEGRGVVTGITNNANPVRIEFDSGEVINAYPDGSHSYGVRTVFFSEPTIIADTMPAKKPFVPKLKAGDKIVMTDRVADYITEVVNEDEYDLLYKTEDGVVAFVKKDSVKVFKLGEEIKWEN